MQTFDTGMWYFKTTAIRVTSEKLECATSI